MRNIEMNNKTIFIRSLEKFDLFLNVEEIRDININKTATTGADTKKNIPILNKYLSKLWILFLNLFSKVEPILLINKLFLFKTLKKLL